MEPRGLYFNHPPNDSGAHAKPGEAPVLPNTSSNTGKGPGNWVGADDRRGGFLLGAAESRLQEIYGINWRKRKGDSTHRPLFQ